MSASLTTRSTSGIAPPLQHVASSPSWIRTWIIQEITLAREIVVLYGSVELPWQLFVNLGLLSATISFGPITSRSLVTQRTIDAIQALGIRTNMAIKMRMRQQSSSLEKKDILAILAENRFTNATDIRDKIYGFYGLAYDSARFVTVDYSKSATETYESFVRRYIEQTQSLNVIFACVAQDGKGTAGSRSALLGPRLVLESAHTTYYL
jgi:hypothetical protein